MLERDDFGKRYAARQPIAIHEFLYHSCRLRFGGDEIHLESGDRPENSICGRARLQKHYGQPQQCI